MCNQKCVSLDQLIGSRPDQFLKYISFSVHNFLKQRKNNQLVRNRFYIDLIHADLRIDKFGYAKLFTPVDDYDCGKIITDNNASNIVKNIVKLIRKVYQCYSCNDFFYSDTKNNICISCMLNMCIKVPDDNCSICLSALSEKAVIKTTCNHFFHRKCFARIPIDTIDVIEAEDEDIEIELRKCPLCRAEITDDNRIYEIPNFELEN